MSRRLPYFARSDNPLKNTVKPQLGTPVLTILIESDASGLMQTKVTGNQPTVMQVVTLLVDSLKGYMDMVNKQASMIIDTSKKIDNLDEKVVKENGREAQENDNGSRGDTSGTGTD